jgi:hypothetical protein
VRVASPKSKTLQVLRAMFRRDPALKDPGAAARVIAKLNLGSCPVLVRGLTTNETEVVAAFEDQLPIGWDPAEATARCRANLIVEGAYGRGKTHALRLVGAIQRSLGAAVAYLDTTAIEGRMDRVTAWLRLLQGTLVVPGVNDDRPGLEAALEAWCADTARRERLRTWAGDRGWIEQPTAIWRRGERTFARELYRALDHTDDDERRNCRQWLRVLGEDLAQSPALDVQLRAAGRLVALARLLRHMGSPRLVLLLDEQEEVMTNVRDIRSRMKLYTYWVEIFNRRLSSTLALWAFAPDQLRLLRDDRRRLRDYQDRAPIRRYLAQDRWPVVRVPRPNADQRLELTRRVIALFHHAQELDLAAADPLLARAPELLQRAERGDPQATTRDVAQALVGLLLEATDA